jgi:hypothetical protein
MSIYVSLLTAGTNSHEESSENANGIATDFTSQGVIGAITNTSGVAPATGAFAVNAQGTPDMTVAVSAGVAYVTGTPTSQNSQNFRVRNTASSNVTISSNSSGSTKYDWLYISLDASKLADPAVNGDDPATLVVSRSSSSSSDDGTPPTYGYCIAVITVANGAASITNGNIADSRVLATSVQDGSIDAGALATNAVTGDKLATSAITLGYAEITSSFTQSGTGTTWEQATGLSVTVTIPTGGRKVKITAWCGAMSVNGSNVYAFMGIFDGTVSGGTPLAYAQQVSTSSNYNWQAVAMAVVTPSAGSKTYNVGVEASSSDKTTLQASSSQPAFILVELI